MRGEYSACFPYHYYLANKDFFSSSDTFDGIMVVFVDLESDDDDLPPSLPARVASLRFNEQYRQMIQDSDRAVQSLGDFNSDGQSEDARSKAAFAAALTCYPYAETGTWSQDHS